MAAIAVTQITTAGEAVPAGVAVSETGDTFVNNGRTYLKVYNSASTAGIATINSLTNCNLGTDHNIAVTVNNTTLMIGPFPMDRFNNSAGLASVTYNAEWATLTVTAISL